MILKRILDGALPKQQGAAASTAVGGGGGGGGATATVAANGTYGAVPRPPNQQANATTTDPNAYGSVPANFGDKYGSVPQSANLTADNKYGALPQANGVAQAPPSAANPKNEYGFRLLLYFRFYCTLLISIFTKIVI